MQKWGVLAAVVAAAGCGRQWACVSEAWVVDGEGAPIEACLDTRRPAACESVIGHPTYAGECAGTFDLRIEDCPGFALSDAAAEQLATLRATGGELKIAACDAPAATGDTSAPTR